jgi:ATP-dependent DNA helicase RecG
MRVSLDTKLKGVLGSKTTQALEAGFGIVTVGDLLAHYPRRLDDRGRLTDFSDLEIGEHVTVLAKTVSVTTKEYRPKSGSRRIAHRTEVVVTDGSDRRLLLTFFRQPWKAGQLKAGTVALFSGKVGVFQGRRQLAQPMVDVLGRGNDLDEFSDEETVRWWPIYPATAQLTSKTIMDSIAIVLDVVDVVADPLPDDVRTSRNLAPLAEALLRIHQPVDPDEWKRAKHRLRFDEAFTLQTVLALRRRLIQELSAIPRPRSTGGLLDRFDEQLPFELTSGQVEVGERLADELALGHPMHRLLQGEVGSGKTVVALRAILQVIDGGGQAALLAPTEVLASQHHRSITALLGPMAEGGMLGGDIDATRVSLITGSMSASRRRGALHDAVSGAAGIVIGTHALLEDVVQFRELGIVVVDEQHRFGVEQRAALTTKADNPPHVLVMTATPIPRTVAMTVFGDLEVSTLRELPAGRRPIQSTVVPTAERPGWIGRVWERVREEVGKGHQAYVVCPRIGGDGAASSDETSLDDGAPGESSADGLDQATRRPPIAVTEMAAELEAGPLAGLRIAMLHGRMAGDVKDQLMRDFASGAIDVLVSTTVIEVGVDVANASVMAILDADRFGVSQLHQLRGRVGRGEVDGLCLLVTDVPAESPARERLEGVAATSDGFELARLDLESRREGDVLGAAQSGRRSSLRLVSVLRDGELIADARTAAQEVVDTDPDLSRHPALRSAVARLEATEQSDFLDKS